VALGGASIQPDKVLAIDAGEADPNAYALRGEATTDPSFGCPAIWIMRRSAITPLPKGFSTVDASTVVATHLNQVLSEKPQALLGPDEVRAILEGVRERAPGLVETVHPTPISLGGMTRLFHALLEDGVSIAHPLPILSALAQAVLQTDDHDRLVDLLRADLGGMLVARVRTD